MKHLGIRTTAVMLLSLIMLSSCSSGSTPASEASESTGADTTPVSSESNEETLYVHGDEGYYSQIEAGIATDVQDQGYSFDCWAYATLDVLRLGYQTMYGKDIGDITVRELKKLAYGQKDEGLCVTEGDMGGSDQFVVWMMSNGYKGYTVIENPNLTAVYKSEDENDPYQIKLATNDQIKEFLRTKGALPVELKYGAGVMHYKGMTLVNDDVSYTENDSDAIRESYLGHEALIVGYDDNFPKEYFGQYGHRMPDTDGAWLYKDSQGETWGDGGYAWLSYDSTFVVSGYITLSDKYSKVLSYDNATTAGLTTGDKTTAANVYHEGGKLAAVGTYVGVTGDLQDFIYGMPDEDKSITIEIRDAELNEVLATKTADFEFDGYYVVELDEPVEVTDFAVVVTYNGYAPVEGRNEGRIRSSLDYISKSEAGQSYVLVDDEWVDVTDPSIVERLNLQEEPNNVCIKALFIE